MNLSGIRDVNELKRLLAMGAISQDDLNNTQLSGSLGPADQMPSQNALQNLVSPQDMQPQQMQQMQQMQQTPPQQPPEGSNFVRNEQTGHVTYLTPQGLSDRPSMGAVIQPQQQQQAPRMMKVIGAGGGTRVDLSPEQAPYKVNLDYSRSPYELMGGARAIYSKDEPGTAYVMGPDGRPSAKIILGYDMQGSMALNKANADLAHSQAETQHTQEETRASQVNNPDWLGLEGGAGGAPGGAGGIDLNNVPPGVLQQAKAMANGDMQLPMTRNGKLNPIAALAFQINPNLKQTDYVQKQATVRDFAPNGTDGQKVKQVNQALHHAGLLLDTIGDLNNTDFAPGLFNPIKNTMGPWLNGADVAPGVYKETADALSAEVRKVYAGSGGGTEGELRDWQASFNPNAGKTQQTAYLKRGMDLLQGGIQALKSSYERGMGPSAKFGDLLDEQAKAGLAKIMKGGVDPGIGDLVGAGEQQQSSGSSAPVRVASQSDYDALPSGSVYQDPNGHTRRKR